MRPSLCLRSLGGDSTARQSQRHLPPLAATLGDQSDFAYALALDLDRCPSSLLQDGSEEAGRHLAAFAVDELRRRHLNGIAIGDPAADRILASLKDTRCQALRQQWHQAHPHSLARVYVCTGLPTVGLQAAGRAVEVQLELMLAYTGEHVVHQPQPRLEVEKAAQVEDRLVHKGIAIVRDLHQLKLRITGMLATALIMRVVL